MGKITLDTILFMETITTEEIDVVIWYYRQFYPDDYIFGVFEVAGMVAEERIFNEKNARKRDKNQRSLDEWIFF